MKRFLPLFALLVAGAACSKPSEAPDAGAPADVSNAADTNAAPGDAGRQGDAAAQDMSTPRQYEMLGTQPDTERLGNRRGYRVVRGVIHAHSVHSHDACDGTPELDDGNPNEPCLDDFRAAICNTRQDYVFLTEHEELAADHDFDELLLQRGADELVMEDGAAVGNRMACENGHRPLLLPGGEFGVMPVGMPAHLPGTVDERNVAYNEVTPERVQSLRDLGAVVLQAHAESKTREELRTLGLDGFEVYQLHANVAPDIREDYLGLEAGGFLTAATPFVQGAGGHPDLLFLTFVEPNRPSLAHFDALVSEGQHLTGTAGTDCHQNVLRMKMTDGERVDSYRRMMRWFSNHLLVEDNSPAALRGALRDGRLAIVFEVLGTPDGFDFTLEAGGETLEMGGSAPLAAAPTIRLQRPEVLDYGPVPVRLEILRITADGAVPVAEGTDTLTYTPDQAGAYRAVVYITPEHLRPHLDELRAPLADEEYEWVWANPVYVTP